MKINPFATARLIYETSRFTLLGRAFHIWDRRIRFRRLISQRRAIITLRNFYHWSINTMIIISPWFRAVLSISLFTRFCVLISIFIIAVQFRDSIISAWLANSISAQPSPEASRSTQFVARPHYPRKMTARLRCRQCVLFFFFAAGDKLVARIILFL